MNWKKASYMQKINYLYRVYEFDMKNVQGKYSVRKGSLEDLCLVPQTYRVDLKEKNANEESDN